MKGPAHLAYGIVRIGDTFIGVPIDQLSEVCYVDAIHPLSVASDMLLGGFKLRDSIVPILNFRKIVGMAQTEETANLLMVLKSDDKVLAICVDEVLELAQTQADKIQPLKSAHLKDSKCYTGMFSVGDKFVSVIDIAALMALPGVYATTVPQKAREARYDVTQVPMLIFEAGGALYSVPAVEVYAAVPRQEILQTAVTSGSCLGEISYYNRRIPVLCAAEVLGLGRPRQDSVAQVVVINAPDDRLIGFAVDAVKTIKKIPVGSLAKPPIWLSNDTFVHSVHVQADGKQIYALDLEALFDSEMIASFSSLSDQTPEPEKKPLAAETSSARSNVIREREKYLVVRAGNLHAIPLSDVSSIVETPSDVTQTTSNVLGFEGYFSHLGHSVALFNLPSMLGATATATQRVVITGEKETQVGFCVEQIIGIEVSQWRETPRQGVIDDGEIVKIIGSEKDPVLPLLRLTEMLAAYG